MKNLFRKLFEAAPSDGASGGAPAPAAKPARQAEKVTMSDGREVEFVGKAKVQKEALVHVHGHGLKAIDELSAEELGQAHVKDLAVRFDFRNGATRVYGLNPALGLRFALHGALQKYGDELAGEDAPDLDDWAATTDKLHERLQSGDWAKARVGGGMAGTSVLLQALVEITGRSIEEVKAFTKDWTPAQRLAMRNDPEIKPVVDKIEAEKAAKTAHVDTGALKAGLKGLTAA